MKETYFGIEKLPIQNKDAYISPEYVAATHPSDEILLTDESFKALYDIWKSDKASDGICPADIFVEGTIPIEDCVLKITDRYSSYRVHFSQDDRAFVVMEMSVKEQTIRAITELLLDDDTNSVVTGLTTLTSTSNDPEFHDRWVQQFSKEYENHYATLVGIVRAWYGVQISLLNPILKEVVSKSRKTKYDGAGGGARRDEAKRKARYIKRHVIKKFDVFDILKKRGITRHTMCWYVIGHWRNQNGKRVWVHPYWKGPLRVAERNLDDGRERLV